MMSEGAALVLRICCTRAHIRIAHAEVACLALVLMHSYTAQDEVIEVNVLHKRVGSADRRRIIDWFAEPCLMTSDTDAPPRRLHYSEAVSQPGALYTPVKVLIATDLASRGLDIPDVRNVT